MSTNRPRLATTVDEIKEKFKHFRTPESQEFARAFVPNPTDIFISPFAKSGTTWMQQIVHSLRTRGDMDFDEIMEVVPWLEMAHDLEIDVHAPQKAHPRAFKSHMTWDIIPKGARYIYTLRNPKDVVVSDYHFLGGWIFDKDAISISEYVQDQYLNSDYYWRHVSSWWSQADNPDVLFLSFEDMKNDLETTIRIVADFMHIDLDADLQEIAKKHASFAFMKAHNHQFDDHLIRDHCNTKMNLPPDAITSKVQTGKVGGHKQQLSDNLIQAIDKKWIDHITPKHGFKTYEELCDAIRVRNQKHFAHLISSS